MRYLSTRNVTNADASSAPVEGKGFSDILLEGLAPDGGLYLPTEYPQVDVEQLASWRELLNTRGYAALATDVLALFIDESDIPYADLAGICERAYRTPTFTTEAIVPVSQLEDGLWLSHLSEGPTAAFKDMAMQLLGELFEYELSRRDDWLTIVGATSGDTGSAAEYALRGRKGLSVVMLTPAGRMTEFQRAQMFSLLDDNIINVAVDGVFDDCQDLVKALNVDAEFKAQWHLGAVNSINWARLLAQVVYYVATWIRVTDALAARDETAVCNPNDLSISVCVPSGNFGNVCAAHIARTMGIPLETLIVATNENDVLDEFFRTGAYKVRSSSQTLATSSPSMDISKASNFERFILDVFDADRTKVSELFGSGVERDGFFTIAGTPEFASIQSRWGMVSGTSTHADRVAEIRRTHEQSKYVLDPHTADGVHVARQWQGRISSPIVVMETALPVKFAETVREAIGEVPPMPERFSGIEGAPQRVAELSNDVGALKALIEERVLRP